MNSNTNSLTVLKKYFKKHKIADRSKLKKLLHTTSRMTIFRKLKKLQYYSSYTHKGKYYTLRNIPQFNNFKIWHYNDIGFSQFGSLKNTAVSIIQNSEKGIIHKKIEGILKLRMHDTLLDLVKEKKIRREKTDNYFLYLTNDYKKAKSQRSNRIMEKTCTNESPLPPWIIIAVLSHIIRTNQFYAESDKIAEELASKGLTLTLEQINQIIEHYDIKKKTR